MKSVIRMTLLFTSFMLTGCATTQLVDSSQQANKIEVADEIETADRTDMRVNMIVACDKTEHDYAIFRDRYDADAFANIFTEDGEWGRSSGRIIKGRDAIRGYVLNLKESAAQKPAEAQMQLTTTVQITPVNSQSATGVSYAMILDALIPAQGLPAMTAGGFQLASESRSTYEIVNGACLIATREYTTLFVEPK